MVRYAKKKDFDFAKRSWEVCFDDKADFIEWNFAHNYSPDDTIIAEYCEMPASIMQLRPYRLALGDEVLDVRYISGVATMPEYRGKGLVRDMFGFALPQMYKTGCDISILIPAVNGMYEKFGYRKVCERVSYFADSLPDTEKIVSYDEELISVLDEIYCKDMQEKSCYIKRSNLDWDRILTDLLCLSNGLVLLFREDKNAVGYAMAFPVEDGFEITEICGRIDFEYSIRPAPPVMARVVNAPRILAKYAGFFAEIGNINIVDEYIAENNLFSHDVDAIFDIAKLTEHIFSELKRRRECEPYINLLL